MGDFLPQLATVGIGLGVLGVSYLVDLIAALANVFGAHTNDKFSIKKLGRGVAKTLLWALSVVGFTVVINLLNWFTERLGIDISNLLEDASVVGILGIIVAASATYVKNTYENIRFFLDKGDTSKQIDVGGVQPDYEGILADAKAFADKITPRWTQEDLQTNTAAEEEVKDNVGQGSSVNPLTRRLPDGDNDNGNGWQAHRLGTLINLYGGGYKKVEDLEIGDELISDTGEKTKVVRAWAAQHPMFQIKTTQGKFYYTPEHPLLVDGKGYVKTKDIQIGDRLSPNYVIENEPQTGLDDSDLILLGYWLGDGYVDTVGNIPKYCVVANEDKKKYLETITNRISWSKHSNGQAWVGYIRKGVGVSDNSNREKVSLLHNYMALCGRYSYGKQIPFNLSLHEREKVLEGYLKADGHERESGFVIATTSEPLARWVQETAWSLKRNSSVYKVREQGYQTNLGVVSHPLWNVSISKDNFDRHNGGFKVTGIEELGVEDTIHIEVDGNHTYVAENIKVHNCSKYAYYLGTGIVMHYAPHPDYGPCNGNQMVDYLCKNYGFVRCGKIAGAIFSYNVGQYGHTGMVLDPTNNIVNDANWAPLAVGTHYINLDAVGAIYCCPPDMLPPEPTPTPEPEKHDDPNKFKVGDWVVVTKPVDIYGTALAVSGSYQVMEISNGSVVIGRNSVITARMWAENLSKTSAPKPAEKKFKVGDTVIPTRLVDYYGTPLYQWDPTYTITEIDGDRAVLSARGQVWAAMNIADLRKA